ncbi:MAG: hypothetical protein IPM51_17270 [Sphingobacteriaceae bacterium]|nr:hypothetical protein [Sphingobacteriaceae bacterium]
MKIRIIISLTFLLFILGDCKKYPEDKFISLRTPKARLESGRWYITKILYDGNDITYLYNDSIAPRKCDDITFLFDFCVEKAEHDPYRLVYLGLKEPSNGNSISDIATWDVSFTEKRKELCLSYGGTYNKIKDTIIHQKIHSLMWGCWEINKLYGKKLHITRPDYNNKTLKYEVSFTKI